MRMKRLREESNGRIVIVTLMTFSIRSRCNYDQLMICIGRGSVQVLFVVRLAIVSLSVHHGWVRI